MLMVIPWANALAITAGIFYIIAWIVSYAAPSVFKYIFDAQFFGANVSNLYKKPSFAQGIYTLIIVLISAWIVGYVWAYIYTSLVGM